MSPTWQSKGQSHPFSFLAVPSPCGERKLGGDQENSSTAECVCWSGLDQGSRTYGPHMESGFLKGNSQYPLRSLSAGEEATASMSLDRWGGQLGTDLDMRPGSQNCH
jgi:hypothetical protein